MGGAGLARSLGLMIRACTASALAQCWPQLSREGTERLAIQVYAHEWGAAQPASTVSVSRRHKLVRRLLTCCRCWRRHCHCRQEERQPSRHSVSRV